MSGIILQKDNKNGKILRNTIPLVLLSNAENAELRVCRTGGAGCAIEPPISIELREKLRFCTPNISRSVRRAPRKVISTPNILHLLPGLLNNDRNANNAEQCQAIFSNAMLSNVEKW